MRIAATVLCFLLLAACGGGSGGGSASPGSGTTANPGPQIALLLCNGHSPVPNYLAAATGPQLEGALQSAGYTVQTSYFVDELTDATTGGYVQLVAKLEQIRDDWITDRSDPTRVVIAGHSHGCVRMHAALRAVTDCPIRLMIDLDGNSIGWTLVGHGSENAAMGGAPEGAYDIAATITCPNHPTITSAPPPFDLEDVVFPHVQEAFEVRAASLIPNPANPIQLIPYDERWNARLDGSTTGLTCYYSGRTHTEAGAPGLTLNAVQAWMLARLASDP